MTKRRKPQKSYWRVVENGGDVGGRKKKRRQESIRSVDVNPEDLRNRNEAKTEAQGA